MNDSTTAKECLNCESPLSFAAKYCGECGQKTTLHRLSLHDVGHEALHWFTHADKGFFFLLRDLFWKTGTVAREYVGGKRKKYFAPLNFYLLVAGMFVLVVNSVSSSAPTNVLKEHPEIIHISDVTHRRQVLRIYERQAKALIFLNKYSNFVAMLALPLLSLIFWLFYKRKTYNYTEHLVSGMYMLGFANLVYVLVFVPLSLLLGIKHSNASLGIFAIFMIFQVSYYTVFYYRFINIRTISAVWKAAGISLVVVLFWFMVSSSLVGLYISNGFWGLVN